jgi:hypothetical protein
MKSPDLRPLFLFTAGKKLVGDSDDFTFAEANFDGQECCTRGTP